MIIKCYCGTPVKNYRNKYCSHSCASKITKNFTGRKHTLEARQKMSRTRLKNPTRYWLGKKKSAKIRENISKGHIGLLAKENHPNWLGGKKKCLDCGIVLSTYKIGRCRKCFKTIQFKNKKPTNLETTVYDYLTAKGLIFEKQTLINNRFTVDAFISHLNIAIEADGKYWHNLPQIIKKDKAENAYFEKCGINLIRLSEDEIKSGKFKERLVF